MCIKKELDKRARRGRRRASLQLGFFPGFGSIVVQLAAPFAAASFAKSKSTAAAV